MTLYSSVGYPLTTKKSNNTWKDKNRVSKTDYFEMILNNITKNLSNFRQFNISFKVVCHVKLA